MSKGMTLTELKSQMAKDAATNDQIAKRGRLAYRMGIERRNNPENAPVARTVWERSWDAAKVDFEAQQARWKNL